MHQLASHLLSQDIELFWLYTIYICNSPFSYSSRHQKSPNILWPCTPDPFGYRNHIPGVVLVDVK